jgi:hypothetical protein
MNSRLKIDPSRSFRRTSSKLGSPSATFSAEIENYFPRERRYRSTAIGEIKLDRSILRLSTPTMEDVLPKTCKLPEKIEFNVNSEVLEFFKVANTPLKKRKNFKYCVLRSLSDFKELNLPPEKVSDLGDIIPKDAYNLGRSHAFIKACKFGALEQVERLVLKDNGLVHSFDHLMMTGLHWSALRNFSSIVSLLISHHSLINPLDCNHRTPLFLASRQGNLSSIKVLMLSGADPNIPSNSKKTPLKVSKSKKVTELLKNYILKFNYCRTLPSKSKSNYWEDHIIPYLTGFK